MGQEELNEHFIEVVESMVERSECPDCKEMDCECTDTGLSFCERHGIEGCSFPRCNGMYEQLPLGTSPKQEIGTMDDFIKGMEQLSDSIEFEDPEVQLALLAADIEDIEDDIQELKKWLDWETETNRLFRQEILAFLRKHYKGEDLSDLCSRFGE